MSTYDPGGTEPTDGDTSSETPEAPPPSAPPPSGQPIAGTMPPPAGTPTPPAGQVGTPGAMPPPADPGWGASIPTATAIPPARKSKTGSIVAILVAVVVVLAVGGYLLTKSAHKTATLPESVAGIPRLHDATATQVETLLKGQTFGGLTLDVALYSPNSDPGFIVLVTDQAKSGDAEKDFSDFSSGFATTSQGSIDQSKKVSDTRGGIQYVCAPATVASTQAGVCVWRDANIFGAVLSFQTVDPQGTLDLTDKVAQAVDS